MPYEPTYWNNRGKYQREYHELHEKLTPRKGKAETPHGELLRTFSNLYYDWFNNGGCNHREDEWRASCHAVGGVWGMMRLPATDEEYDALADAVIEYCLRTESELDGSEDDYDPVAEHGMHEPIRYERPDYGRYE